jgi:4-hydroxybenzoate polyprenyltransferase
MAAQDGDAEVIARTAHLFVRMLRVRVAITMWTFMLIGLARHGTPAIGRDLILATVAIAASYVTATTLNDLADADIDRVNRPADRGRPLVAGDASPADLWRTHRAATGVAAAAAIPLGTPGVVVVGTSLLLGYAYSGAPFRVSRRWSLAPLLLAAAYVVIPYALGVALAGGRWGAEDVPTLAGLFVLFLARIVLKDFRDRLGDERFGKRTVLQRVGKDATCRFGQGGAVVGGAVLIAGLAPTAVAAAVLGLAVAGIVWQLEELRRTPNPRLEQVAIGLAARIGNGLLCGSLAWLLLERSGASPAQATSVVVLIGVVFALGVGPAALDPRSVRIGYKPWPDPQDSARPA